MDSFDVSIVVQKMDAQLKLIGFNEIYGFDTKVFQTIAWIGRLLWLSRIQ